MNKFKRIFSAFLCIAMLITETAIPAYADDLKEENIEASKVLYTIDDEVVSDAVYFDTSLIRIKEDSKGDSIRIINKSGTEGSLRLKLTDISASYGKDYLFSVDGEILEAPSSDSISLLDYMASHSDEMSEYNYTDAILDGSIIPDSLDNELSEEQIDAFEEAVPSLFKSIGAHTDVPDPDGSAESLRAAFEAATGLQNDKTSLDGSAFMLPEIESINDFADKTNELSNISEALNNPVFGISFGAGEKEKIIEILPIQNSESCSERRTLISLASDNMDVASGYASCTIEFIDDEEEAPSSLSFSQSSYYANDGFVEVSVIRSGDLSTTCSAKIYTEDISASAGKDYSFVNAVLDFPMGIQKRVIKIPVISDDLNEQVCFSVNLAAKSACVIGDASAVCAITPKTAKQVRLASKSLMLAASNPDVLVGNSFNLPQMYLNGDGKVDGTIGWRLVADDDWFSSETSSVSFALSPGYAYNGFRINWSRSQDFGNGGNTKFWIEGKDNSLNSSYDNLYNKGTDEWFNDIDDYYANNLVRIESLNFELEKDSFGDTPYLYIHNIKPILREFKVRLASYEPVKLLDESGQLVSCTQSGEYYKNLSTVQISGTSASGVLTTVASDTSSITISLPDTTDPIAYIKGVEIVSPDGESSHTIVDNLPMGLQTYSIKFDNQFVFDNSGSYGLIKYTKEEGKGYYGEFNIRPILANIDAEVSVTPSDYVNITADQNKLNRKGTAYVYHRGDYISFDVSMKPDYASAYRCPSIFYTQGGPNSSDLARAEVVDGANGQTVGFRITRKEVNVSANVTAKNTEFLVKVATADIPKFNPDSDLFKYQSRTEGSYTYYVVADKEHFDASKMYELSVLPAEDISINEAGTLQNPAAVPVWTEPATGISYTQNCIWLSGNASLPEFNTISLSILTSHTYDVPLEGSVFYYDSADEAYAVGAGWMPAAGAVISIDNFHYGISAEDGSFSTLPIPIVNNAKKKYTIKYRVESYGNVSYRDITLTSTVLSAIKRDGKLHVDAAEISATPKNAPSLSSVTLVRSGVLQTGILINDLAQTEVTVNIANSGIPYEAANGETLLEKPCAVDLLIYDSVTKKQKGDAIACAATTAPNNAEWKASLTVTASGADPDDLLCVRITTDRKCSLTDDAAILNQTVYAPVPVRARFIASEYESPREQNFELTFDQNALELPLIGTLVSTFYINDFVFSVQTDAAKGITRFYVGNISALSADYSAALAGENYFTPASLGQTAEDMTNAMSEISELTGNIVCGVPYWKVRAEAGLYFDFAEISITTTSASGEISTVSTTKFVGAGGYFGLRNKVDFCYYVVILGWPCYMGGNIEFKIGAYLGAEADSVKNSSLTTESLVNGNALSNLDFDAMVVAKLDTSLYAGVGICRVAGVRGVFSLTISFVSDPYITQRIPEITHTTGWNVSGSMDVILDMLLFTVPINVGSWDYLESGYFEDSRNLISDKLMSLSSVSDDGSLAYFRKGRSEDESVWMGDKRLLASPGPGAMTSERVLINKAYDQADPQIMHYVDDNAKDHMLLVYVDDDQLREDDERTALYYSICTDGQWTLPEMIQDDGTADFSPNLCDTGDKILLSWASRKADSLDGSMSSIMSSMEIFTCFFEKNTGEFGTITQMTDDEYYDAAPIAVCDLHPLARIDTEAHTILASGNIVLHYLKSAVPEDINTADDYISAVLPLYNCAEPVYMIYDGENDCWVQSYYDNELASGVDASEFAAKWKGQRFLDASIAELGMTNPVITDLALGDLQYIALSNERYHELISSGEDEMGDWIVERTNSTKNAAIFAYTIDQDKNLDTGYDRELYIQLYDYNNHATSKPIQITDNNLAELDPQIVTAEGSTWLFWLEEGGDICYIDISSALDRNVDDHFNLRNSANWEIQKVSSKECVDTKANPCPIGYKAFGTEDGYLYVAWQQNVDSDSRSQQALYLAARSYDVNTNSYRWSNASRINSNMDISDLPTVAALDNLGSSWIMVNNQSNLDPEGEYAMSVKTSRLVATTINPVSRCDIDSISVETNAKTAIDTKNIDLTLNIVNNGLTAADSFIVESKLIRNGIVERTKTSEWQRSGDLIPFPLHPGNSKKISQDFAIEDDANLTDYSLEVSVTDGRSNVVSKDVFSLYESGSFYELSSVSANQEGDNFVLNATIKNVGAEVTNADDIVTVDFNDIYGLGSSSENFGSIKVGEIMQEAFDENRGLNIGEMISFKLPLNISDEKLANGYVNAKISVAGCEKTFAISLETPYNLSVNGSQNKIILYEGQSINLVGSYKGEKRYGGGIFNFVSKDNSVAMTDGNKLTALSAGKTILDMNVVPYGGMGSVEVEVLPSSEEPVAPDSDAGVTPGKVEDNPFIDVKANDYFYDAVLWAAKNGITSGVDATHFNPLGVTTRAQMVTFLWRAAGCPEPTEATCAFTDVKADAYYYKAVLWAVETGITKGTSDTTFSPDAVCTRGQTVTLLARFAGVADEATGYKHDFADVNAEDYFNNAVAWAKDNKVTEGTSASTFSPNDDCTRAQVVTFLYRWMVKDKVQ